MKVTISNEIRIQGAPKELVDAVREELSIPNPEYSKKQRMGLWTGNTEQKLYLYYVDGLSLVIPCGSGKLVRPYLDKDTSVIQDLADNGTLLYAGEVPLYDYQELAVEAMQKAGCGILQSPCGSGKTQMGIALAAKLQRKTLWLTHTTDLLNQSCDRAKQYYPEECLGKITGVFY